LNIQALHTPGHAPHHITWICNKDAFVGDSAGLWYPNLEKSFPVTPGYYRHDLALESIEKMSLLDLEYLHYTHFGPRYSKGVLEITRSEFKIWMNIVEEGYSANLSAKDILEKLFDNRPGLIESDRNHGVHQRSTHLGTVEGMMNWLRREDAQG
jgi:glyoxylase-like metal-dependent hydrolase (beta-lactamase superfamily II)